MPEINEPTDFNDLACLAGLDEVRRQITGQLEKQSRLIKGNSNYTLPECFRVNKSGVFYVDPNPDNQPLKLCSKLEVMAFTHDEDDCNHGLLLEWTSDRTGQHHTWAMPCRMLAGDGGKIREKLLDEGLTLIPGRKAREKLLEYIQSVKPERQALSLSRIGWHGDSFALPDIVYPETNDMVLQSEGGAFETFRVSGTLQEWQENVACYAAGNSRLIFALSIAFAAPLLKVAGEESGAVHFVGHSSKGKTSALRISGSVWGGGGENGFIKQWRSTGNAQEAIAEQHRDCLLPLDELGQADSKTVGETVYMLANNQGKSRMKSSAVLKRTYEWRVLVISSGEVTLEAKMQEAGKKAYAGMEVRFINIPAEVEGAHGVFEELHGFATGHEFSKHLQEGCSKYYGTAIRTFLEGIAGKADTLVDTIRTVQEDFNSANVKSDASGQVKRVAGRFGLIAAAGELAIAMGILPLQEGDALNAASRCFNDWLESRGSTDNLETEKAIAQIRSYLERYGTSKFIIISDSDIETGQNRAIERMGYKQKHDGVYHYYILPEGYKSELCKGFNPRMVTSALAEKGYLVKDSNGKNQVNKTFPGEAKQRVYQISPAIFEGYN